LRTVYEIDPTHSSVLFSVRHLMVSNVRGSFTSVKGSVAYDPADPASTTVTATIDASTIHTHDEKRDEHLRSAEFLDVAKFPTLEFKSTSVKKTGDTEFEVTGNLSVHGVTKPVTFKVEDVSPEAKDPWGNTRIGAMAKAKLKRSDFGLTWNAPLETGGVLVGDEVKLDFELEFIQAKSAAA